MTAAVDDDESAVHRPRRRHHQPQQRQRKLTIRVSPDEEAEIQHAAAERTLTVARFIATSSLNAARRLTADHDPEERRDHALDELAAARHQVARCGNNLNQIARELNSGGLPNPADLVAALTGVRSTIAAIDTASAKIAKER
ncbi:plasmid mobilization relaxosome protein MobC [Kitasatospora sp. NPDC058032]|uniref:plasmid mobilization protein n=1 Tax=Kitasatospora sp. NPDC058032 TaxID=3346307 RepID=UPI0036D9939C